MSELLQQLNDGLAEIAAIAHRSLVRVADGRHGNGAGVIVHSDGLVLTNAHVARRSPMRVLLPDGRTVPARLLARNEKYDLAALRMDEDDLPAIELGTSGQLRPGEWVLSVGHPWGIPGAATAGVVIGVGQGLPDMPGRTPELLAVGLHLRPGHSGGPMVDSQGRLIGINTMMAGPEVGLAVPVDTIKAFLREALSPPGAAQESATII
jgi:S1-C subfamily serine protease